MSNKIITSALSALIALTAAPLAAAPTPEIQEMINAPVPNGMERCYGIAKKGMNDCASVNQNCAGEAKTDGQKNAWLLIPAGLCSKIVGGSTKPQA